MHIRTRFALAAVFAISMMLSPQTTNAAGVVGNGAPSSCTPGALAVAMQAGGIVTFNCGSAPVTIVADRTFEVTAASTVIDGGGLITLSGGGVRRIIRHRSRDVSSSLTLRGLTLEDGFASGIGTEANGAAIVSRFEGQTPAFRPTLVIEQVTFRNNRSVQMGAGGNAYDYGGGAIYSQGGTVSVAGSQFLANRADNGSGGAIHILQSVLSVSGTTFDGNSAIGSTPADSLGGAIYIDGLGGSSGVFTLSDSAFTNNTSYNSGGAIYVNMYEDSTRMTVVRSSFIGNALVGGSGALGGAISGGGTSSGTGTGNPRIEISDSTFAENRARRSAPPFDGSGGALAFAQRTVLTITNSTFSGNQAEGSSFNANGGALYVVNNTDPFVITNSTFAGNTAGWVGGAISNSQISSNPGGVLRNTIFSNNSAANGGNTWAIQQHCSSELTDGSNNLQYPPRNTNQFTFNEVSCLQGKSAINQRTLPDFRDPRLLSLIDSGGPTMTIPLAHDSPAIDAGNPASCPPADQRGIARNGICDIGAHEFAATPYLGVLTPPFAQVGHGDLTLTVIGADFRPTSAVQWDGSIRTTTFINSSQLSAVIPATDFGSAGTIPVTVSTGANITDSLPFRILTQVVTVALPLVVKEQ